MIILATITIVLFIYFIRFVILCKSTPYNGSALKSLKKGTEFYYNCNRYVKHIFDRTVNKYVCLSDYEVITLSGNTIVLTDRGSR
jgi:YHS domain-containing protein